MFVKKLSQVLGGDPEMIHGPSPLRVDHYQRPLNQPCRVTLGFAAAHAAGSFVVLGRNFAMLGDVCARMSSLVVIGGGEW